MKLETLVSWLNEYLKISEFNDVSINGLQVEASYDVKKICVAVDASLEVFEHARFSGCDLLIVHHGLYWQGVDFLMTGILNKRVRYLLESKISLYAAHLPLDAHEEVGNNVEIIRKLGLRKIGLFNEYAWKAEPYEELSILDLYNRAKNISSTVKLWNFGPNDITKVYVSSGASSGLVYSIPEESTLITGEFLHYAYHIAKEKNINVISLGHYESEKFGVIALANKIEALFKIPYQFIDVPTNL